MNRVYYVENMSCVNCKKILANALSGMDGVEKITINLPYKEIMVDADFEKVSDSDIISIITSRMYLATRKIITTHSYAR